jgi:uncharacterized membrane protein YbhN (UPF0104 family)
MESGQQELNTESEKSSSPFFRTVVFFGRLIVAAVVTYLVLRMVSVEKIVLALKTASLPYIAVGSALLLVNIASRVMKWRSMLHIVKDESSWWEAFSSVLLGVTLGSFTPGQIGELGGRSMRVTHSKSSHIVGLTLVDRTQVFLVIVMAGTLSYAFFLTDNTYLAIAIGLLCTFISLYLYFRLDLVKRVADKINLKILRHHWIDGIIESFTFIGREHFVSTLVYSLAFYIIISLQMYFFVNAFVVVSLWKVFLGFSAMMFFKSLVNISISDIGIREASTVYFFSLLGVPDAAALSASIVMFAVNIIIPSLVGVFFLPQWRRLKATTDQASTVSETTK